jgi:SAM-dependent methyltransferase
MQLRIFHLGAIISMIMSVVLMLIVTLLGYKRLSYVSYLILYASFGAILWGGWENLPIWMIYFCVLHIFLYGFKVEEFAARLIRFDKRLGYIYSGVMAGFPLIQGHSAIIDSYKISVVRVGRRFKERNYNVIKKISKVWISFCFNIETLLLVLAEYIVSQGRDGILVDITSKYKPAMTKPMNNKIKLHEVYCFDGFSELYAEISSKTQICPEWSKTIIDYLDEGMSVLDVGSGTGRLYEYIQDKCGDKYLGVEQNEFLYEYSKKKYGDKFKNMFLPYGTLIGKFDIVLMHQNVLIEIVNAVKLDDILISFSELLNDNGYLIFDYPEKFYEANMGEYIQVVDMVGDKGAQFIYGFVPINTDGIEYNASLKVVCCFDNCHRQESDSVLGFKHLPLMNIIKKMTQSGFVLISNERCNIETYYPADINIIVMKKG